MSRRTAQGEVGFESEEIHDMAVQIRRAASAAERLGVERETILDAERRVEMAQKKIDQIESDARLEADDISDLIETIKKREEAIYKAKMELVEARKRAAEAEAQ